MIRRLHDPDFAFQNFRGFRSQVLAMQDKQVLHRGIFVDLPGETLEGSVDSIKESSISLK